MLLGILLLIPSFTTGQVSKYSAYRDTENGRHLPAAADDGSSSYKEQQRSPRASGNLPEDLVSEIHCMDTPTTKSFSASLRLPIGHASPPVLEHFSTGADGSNSGASPTIGSGVNIGGVANDDSSCTIISGPVPGMYNLELAGRLQGCGVRKCTEQGEEWLCLLVRFPLLKDLMLPEDEIIDIKCRPQDRSIVGSNAVNFQENLVEKKSPAIFTGGGQDFLSEIGLFRKLAGTDLFAARVKSGSTIELGENVQLRSIVRSGDGWKYSMLTDIIVHRVHNGKALSGSGNMVRLVHKDGCRDDDYKALAPYHPWKDDPNQLINNFDFRVFMFQNMEPGDSIMITAQVVACVEEIDCALQCGGGRVRRDIDNTLGADTTPKPKGRMEGWEENLEIKVSMSEQVTKDSLTSVQECRLYLILTLATALTFCLLSAAIVIFACIRRWKETKRNLKKLQLSNNPADQNTKNSLVEIDSSVAPSSGHPSYYLVPCGGRATQQHNSRPVTVRSVKRRDRGKSLERRIGQEAAVAAKSQLAANMAAAAHQHTSLPNVATAGNGYMTNDEKAVMV